MEFELYSGNFIGKHDLNKCDLIVCWINNWRNPPQNIKILELKEVHKQLVAQKGLRLIFKDEQKHPPPEELVADVLQKEKAITKILEELQGLLGGQDG